MSRDEPLKKEILESARGYLHNNDRKKHFRILVIVLSLAVALSTFYFLALPAIALEKQPDAGDESALAEEGALPTEEVQGGDDNASQGSTVSEYTYKADGLYVKVAFDDPSAISDDAVLSVARIDGESDPAKYDLYRKMLSDDIEGEASYDFVVYELSFYCEGQKVEPSDGAATVTIKDADAWTAEDMDGLQVYCAPKDDASAAAGKISGLQVNGEENQIVFTVADHPAVCMVTEGGAQTSEESADSETSTKSAANGETEGSSELSEGTGNELPADSDDDNSEDVFQRTEYTYEGDGLSVKAVLSDPSAIPDDAELTARRITADSDPESYAQYLKLLQNSTGSDVAAEFLAYDIGFYLDGQEIEPNGGTVDVTIEDTAEVQSAEAVQVYHVLDEDSGTPELQEVSAKPASDADTQEISFAADSFSVYLITNGYSMDSSLTYKVISQSSDTYTNTDYYNPARPLGIAGNFHIVAFGTATLNAHTDGNILANQLNAQNSNFGTSGLTDELSYIQNYSGVNSNSASSDSHVLALGTNNTVSLTDNGHAFAVNNTKLDHPKNVWQDADTSSLPFINLNTVKTEISTISSNLSAMTNNNIDDSNLSTSAGSCDASYITLTDPGKVGIYNITASELDDYQYFGVKGFTSGTNEVNGTVIINVDCSGYGMLKLPECGMYVDNGSALGCSETINFINGKILWNFYHCTTSTTIENDKNIYASMIALNATVITHSNLNGTIIANNVTISAESHRDDFVGDFSTGGTVTADKVWLGNDGNPLSEAPANTSVTLQLYRSDDHGVTKTAYGDPVTLNSTSGWSYSWTDLSSEYEYSVEETQATESGSDVTDDYKITYSSDSSTAGETLYVYNQITYKLPDTGGAGSRPYTIAGLLLISLALSAVGLRRFKAKKRENIRSG